MIELNIPGKGRLHIQHLVFDVNGTLAVDGQLREGLADRLATLADQVEIHLVTADTYGQQSTLDQELHVQAERLEPGNEAEQKAEYVRRLGAEQVIAIGQGVNDTGMLKTAALGICIGSPEGTAVQALLAADIFVADIFSALDLIEKPQRIIASLRQ